MNRVEKIRTEGIIFNIKEKKRYDQKQMEFTFKKQHLRHRSKETVPAKDKKSLSPHSKSVWI